MKKLFALLSLVITTASFATVTCQDIKNVSAQEDFNGFEFVRDVNVVNLENWKNFDVIANFNRRVCLNELSQKLIKVNGQNFVEISTANDSCDGGNTYGAIYSEDLSTVVAHINDSDIYCNRWSPNNLASNHRCDLGAEEFAVNKMRAKGFNMTNVTSILEVKNGRTYSFIEVTGTLENQNRGDGVTVMVTTNLTNCKYLDAVITGLRL